MYGDSLSEQLVLVLSPRPPDTNSHQGQQGSVDQFKLCTNLDARLLLQTTNRGRSRMALVQGYSSDEDDGHVPSANDAFGLASITTKDKIQAEQPQSTSLVHSAAPDVLSEVCFRLISRNKI